ncbi:MAG: hypothetical protein KKB94_02110, partial [Proteobacteria bacterium]|nr:hypothetical protein [Pseudomonadota bacterium]
MTNFYLKEQANQLINSYSLYKWDVIPTGSYYLDLMVCPDLDVYFESVEIRNLFIMAEEFYQNDLTNEVYVMKGSKIDMPEGEHIQIRTNLKYDSVKWKIDIWFFPSHIIAEKQTALDKFLEKLNPKNRETIIKIKSSLIQKSGFTPKMSSYHVYEAIL